LVRTIVVLISLVILL